MQNGSISSVEKGRKGGGIVSGGNSKENGKYGYENTKINSHNGHNDNNINDDDTNKNKNGNESEEETENDSYDNYYKNQSKSNKKNDQNRPGPKNLSPLKISAANLKKIAVKKIESNRGKKGKKWFDLNWNKIILK